MVARCEREWHRELSHLIDGFRNESSKIKLFKRLKFNPSAPIDERCKVQGCFATMLKHGGVYTAIERVIWQSRSSVGELEGGELALRNAGSEKEPKFSLVMN